MHKRYKTGIFLLLALCLMWVSTAYTLETKGDLMARRGGRGIVNMATSPLDIVNTVEETRFKEGWPAALSYGIMKGVGRTVGRTFYGLYEVVTFYKASHDDKTFDVHYDEAFFRI